MCEQFSLPCSNCSGSEQDHAFSACGKPDCRGRLSDGVMGRGPKCDSCSSKIVPGSIVSVCKSCHSEFCSRCKQGWLRTLTCSSYDPVPNNDNRCGCGKTVQAHPWEEMQCDVCKCGEGECMLFTLKTFLCNGLVPLLLAIMHNSAQTRRYCLQLLFLLQVPEQNFVRCLGGSFFKVVVEKVGKQEPEFLLHVSTNKTQNTIRKKIATAVMFQEKLTEALKGIVQLPETRKNKSKADGTEIARANMIVMFDVLGVPENFQKMIRVPAARTLLFEFLEIDSRPSMVTRNTLSECVMDCVRSHQHSRDLPSWMLQLLTSCLCGGDLPCDINLASSLPKLENPDQFPLTKLSNVWVLSLVLAALPAASAECAIAVLEPLQELFAVNPPLSILADPNFISWFSPLLNDKYDGFSRSMEIFQMTVNILAELLIRHIFVFSRTENANQREAPELLLATIISSLGSDNETSARPWPLRRMEIVSSITNEVLGRLASVVSNFVEEVDHVAWENTYEVLNVFRNMMWCSREEKSVVNHLISAPQMQNRHLLEEPADTFLTEQAVMSILDVLQAMELHDRVTGAEDIKAKLIKQTGLAYVTLFRACLTIFRGDSANELKLLALLYGTVPFEITVSRDEEERLKYLDDLDTARLLSPRAGVMGAFEMDQEHERQQSKDLALLSAGLRVWRASKSSKQNVPCMLYLKRQVAHSEQKLAGTDSLLFGMMSALKPGQRFSIVLESRQKKSVRTLFDQVTVALNCDVGALARTNLGFAAKMALTFVEGKQRTNLVFLSEDECECWSRVVRSLMGQLAPTPEGALGNERDIDQSLPKPPEPTLPINLHQVLLMVHRFCNTTVSGLIKEFSEKVQNANIPQELGDLNRLNYILQLWQVKFACDVFRPRCIHCEMIEKQHHEEKCKGGIRDFVAGSSGASCASCAAVIPPNGNMLKCTECKLQHCVNCRLTCRAFVPAPASLCAKCDKPVSSHPWDHVLITNCVCGTDECLLATLKTFLAHAGMHVIRVLLAGASGPFRLPMLRCVLSLTTLFTTIPEPAFVRCWGGATTKVHVLTTPGIQTEFLLFTEMNGRQNCARKSLQNIILFQETLTKRLTLPLPKEESKTLDVSAAKANLTALFEFLNVPDHFQKMSRLSGVRQLLLDFLEVDVKNLYVGKASVLALLTEFLRTYPDRTVPYGVLRILCDHLTGDGMRSSLTEQIRLSFPEPEQEEFSVVKLREPWGLALVFAALRGTPDDLTIACLREINHFFIHPRAPLFVEEGFPKFLLPFLFERHKELKAGSKEIFQLGLNLIVVILAQHVLVNPRTDQYPERYVAASILAIGSYDGEQGLEVAWEKRHIEIVQLLCNGIVSKLATMFALALRNNLEGQGWKNVFPLFNLFRNMTWCPPVSTNEGARMLEHLLYAGSTPQRNLAIMHDTGFTLLSEHTISGIVNLLQEMKLFNIVVPGGNADPADVTRIKMIKGSGLAYLQYFRSCLTCFQTTRDLAAQDQVAMIAQFFDMYNFTTVYSREDEEKMKTIEMCETRRRRSLERNKSLGGEIDSKKRKKLDLEALAAGSTVWIVRISSKKKVRQGYASLQVEATTPVGGAPTSPTAGASEESKQTPSSLSLVLESKGKREAWTLFDQCNIETSCDSKLLAKHGLEFGSQLGLTLSKQKKPYACLVCSSGEDYECWVRVLTALRAERIKLLPTSLQTKGDMLLAESSSDVKSLQQVAALIHRFCNVDASKECFEHSEASELEFDVAELSRLQYLINASQNSIECSALVRSCASCGRSEKDHRYEMHDDTCKGFFSDAPANGAACSTCGNVVSEPGVVSSCQVCNLRICANCQQCCPGFEASKEDNCASCGRSRSFHPVKELVTATCWCDSDRPCFLFILKSWLLHGGHALLQRMLQSSPPHSPVQVALLQHCVALLWVVTTVPEASFGRCRGGTNIKVSIEQTISPDNCLTLIVEAFFAISKLKKKLSALHTFHKHMAALLKGRVELPPVLEESVTDPQVLRASYFALFGTLANQATFQAMLRVTKARMLFREFLELEPGLRVTRMNLVETLSQFVCRHQKQRNLPGPFFNFLARSFNTTPVDALEPFSPSPPISLEHEVNSKLVTPVGRKTRSITSLWRTANPAPASPVPEPPRFDPVSEISSFSGDSIVISGPSRTSLAAAPDSSHRNRRLLSDFSNHARSPSADGSRLKSISEFDDVAPPAAPRVLDYKLSEVVIPVPQLDADPWLLQILFLAVPVTTVEAAVVFLHTLREMFANHPQFRTQVFTKDLQTRFYPILFETRQDDERVFLFQIAVDILSSTHIHNLLSLPRREVVELRKRDERSGERKSSPRVVSRGLIDVERTSNSSPRDSERKSPYSWSSETTDSAEGLLAAALAAMTFYAGDFDILQRNVLIAQAVITSLINKLILCVPSTFRYPRSAFFQTAWGNILEVLNVCRNMMWCPLLTDSRSHEPFIKHLVNRSSYQSRNFLALDRGFALLSEHIAALILRFLHLLKLSDLEFGLDTHLSSFLIKRTALAYVAYFKDCSTCFVEARCAIVKNPKQLAQFYATYNMEATFAEISEQRISKRSRLPSLVAREQGLAALKTDAEIQTADLLVLLHGIPVYRVKASKKDAECCFLYLTPATDNEHKYVLSVEAKGKKRLIPLGETTSLITRIDATLLALHHLELLQQTALTLWVGKKKKQFVCCSIDDFESWKRVLSLGSAHLLYHEAKRELSELPPTHLQTIVLRAHEFCPTSLSRTLVDYFSQIRPESTEFELQGVRFLMRSFQAKQGCEVFSVPCQNCSKRASAHPWQQTFCFQPGCNGILGKYTADDAQCNVCHTRPVGHSLSRCFRCDVQVCHSCIQGCQNFVPSTDENTPCACGKARISHPWEISVQDCRCSSRDACTLLTVKSFVAHGGVRWIQRLFTDSTLALQLEYLRLLVLLSSISEYNFARCLGGTTIRVSCEILQSKTGGIGKHEPDFLFTWNAVLLQAKIQRKFSQVVAFLDAFLPLLKGLIELPELPRAKTPLNIQACANSLFTTLGTPTHFQKLARLNKAYVSFLEFLEVDLRPLQVTKSYVTQCVNEIVRKHRTLPEDVLPLFISLIEQREPSGTNCVIHRIQDPSQLAFACLVLPTVPEEQSIQFLVSLTTALANYPENYPKLGVEFGTWFFPLLFCTDDSRSRPKKLAIDLLGAIFCYRFLHNGTKHKQESIEHLLVNNILQLLLHSTLDSAPLSRRNIEVLAFS